MAPHNVNFKKALGAKRPNEKRLGKAISPPPCERGVPLYPLRYGGWSIQMHKDARVALEYLYFPDPDSRPDIALRQPHAPTPLQFSSGGWLSDPISSALLEPIRSPSNV
ncbi:MULTISPECIES: hypothetical protein [Achromobacter]|uniref:hypothetical protein n=1 Tax=Achromobacter TaxID=222 RepID=UPI0024497341|nr:hypothetical protein [Achromobacter mucicolens]MDH1522706.1 hypothetical protein [Achromobacter mucicolens]